MAGFQEDGDRKLQIFAYLHVGVTTLSITIGLYLNYGTASFTEIKILRVSGTLTTGIIQIICVHCKTAICLL